MTHSSNFHFEFTTPAIYKIVVAGHLDESWSDRLNGMQINMNKSQSNDQVSILIGQLNDQSALSGVLNTLHDFHMTVISVNVLDEIDLDHFKNISNQ